MQLSDMNTLGQQNKPYLQIEGEGTQICEKRQKVEAVEQLEVPSGCTCFEW